MVFFNSSHSANCAPLWEKKLEVVCGLGDV